MEALDRAKEVIKTMEERLLQRGEPGRLCLVNENGRCLYLDDLRQLVAAADVTVAGLTPEMILREREEHARELASARAATEAASVGEQRSRAELMAFGTAVKSLGMAMTEHEAQIR